MSLWILKIFRHCQLESENCEYVCIRVNNIFILVIFVSGQVKTFIVFTQMIFNNTAYVSERPNI